MITLRSLMCCGGSDVTDPEEPPQDVIVEKKAQKTKATNDKFEGTQSTKEKGKAKDVQQVVSSVHPARHFETEITPKNEHHMQFLKACAGFDGNLAYGKVHANLDAAFFTWLEQLDPADVRQAYIDALCVRGEKSSSLTDSVTLVTESGAANNWSAEDIKALNTVHNNALKALGLFHEERSKSRFHLPGVHISGSLKKAYQNAAGGEMKSDYLVYVRSLEFCDKLKAAAKLGFSAAGAAAIKKMMSEDNDGGKAVVIALKRLQLLRERPISSATV